jgi:phosphoribosyl 1,2-cyclic phosphodiesterase
MNNDLTVCSLGSGSRGNATYISDGNTSVLIDAGFSAKELERRMSLKGISPESLNAIVISHEHADHVNGVSLLSRKYHIPVCVSSETYKAASPKIGNVFEIRQFVPGSGFAINDLTVHPFSISHDAKDPCGFTIRRNGTKIGIATDLGIATHVVREHLKGCRVLILEANHDPEMLMNGPYPWFLKQRVRGRTGHLSNHDTARLLKEILHDGLTHVVLGHISQKNNTVEKALSVVGEAINASRINLCASVQDRVGDTMRV